MSTEAQYNFQIENQKDFSDGWRSWTLKFECEKNLGQGFAVLLRHIIMAKTPSYAVKALAIRTKKIDSPDQVGYFNVAPHNLCSIDGLVENIDSIIGNISKIIFVNKDHKDDQAVADNMEQDQDIVLNYRFTNPGAIYSSSLNDQSKNSNSSISAANDVLICNLDKGMVLDLIIIIGYKNGYVQADDQLIDIGDQNDSNSVFQLPMENFIKIDTCYSMITRVRTQVDSLEGFDQVQIHVTSAKSQGSPVNIAKDAIYRGLGLFANCLGYDSDYNNLGYDPLNSSEHNSQQEYDKNMGDLQDSKLELFAFNPQVVTCLQKAGIYKMGDLLKHTLREISSIYGVGIDGCSNIVKTLKGLGLNLL